MRGKVNGDGPGQADARPDQHGTIWPVQQWPLDPGRLPHVCPVQVSNGEKTARLTAGPFLISTVPLHDAHYVQHG